MGMWNSWCTNEEKQKEMSMDIDISKNKDQIYQNKVKTIQAVLRTYLDQK